MLNLPIQKQNSFDLISSTVGQCHLTYLFVLFIKSLIINLATIFSRQLKKGKIGENLTFEKAQKQCLYTF